MSLTQGSAEEPINQQSHHQHTQSEPMTTPEGAPGDAERPERGERSVGECRNILPVLVEHLCSALRGAEPPHACPMDLNLDLRPADVKTALLRLQDTLRRVDADALSRFSSSLEQHDKLHLLQLISNLLANLKHAKLEETRPPAPRKRQGRARHTIGVSSEELATARKWLEERGHVGASLVPLEGARATEKHVKDALNQQQSLQARSKDLEEPRTLETLEATKNPDVEPYTRAVNKFTVKKSKIKRANTIDIPNYLKLQAEKSSAGSPGLRRPIDISDRQWNQAQLTSVTAVPSFEPKTDNDRKFLALISRNSDSSASTTPVRSFYRQAGPDKNWRSRFSNIKTTFDRSEMDHGNMRVEKQSGGVLVASLRLSRPSEPLATPAEAARVRLPAFTHAASSPFQKIRGTTRSAAVPEPTERPPATCYLPACASGGMLRAKVKMFDTEAAVDPGPRTPPEREKGINSRRQSVAVQTPNFPLHFDDSRRSSVILSEPPPRPKPPARYSQPQGLRSFLSEGENPIYVPPRAPPRDRDFSTDVSGPREQNYWPREPYNGDRWTEDNVSEDQSFMDDENIENQDISEDKVVTRYTGAIGTVEKSPPRSPVSSPKAFDSVIVPEYRPEPAQLRDDVLRHNMLQQSLIRRMQRHEEEQERPMHVVKPSQRYSGGKFDQEVLPPPVMLPTDLPNGRESIEPLIESNNTQDKINIFEEKCARKVYDHLPEPLVIARPPYAPALPKINVVSPSRSLPHGYVGPVVAPPEPVKYSSGPGDSSDEYLVSCASRPHRSIVLSKSESWHQLALAKTHLQVPQPAPAPAKPPRMSSQAVRHADPGNSSLKKMEEKVQRYFSGSGVAMEQKKESKSGKRTFVTRKNQGPLSRSQTMPQIYDDTDVDQVFNSLFEETTRDNRL